MLNETALGLINVRQAVEILILTKSYIDSYNLAAHYGCPLLENDSLY